MPANVHDINDASFALPEFVLLDASIILELSPDPAHSHPKHTAAVNFLSRLQVEAINGNVLPVLPIEALEECYFKIAKRIIFKQWKLAGRKGSWDNYYKSHPNIILDARKIIINLCQTLQSIPVFIPEPEELAVDPIGTEPLIADRMMDMMFNYCLLPKDALILTSAERMGINTVATLDFDWTRADGFTVLTII